MLIINRIFVENTYTFDYRVISWTCEDTYENTSDYTFAVYRSDSPAGPFMRISDYGGAFSFNDYDISFKTPSAIYYYKIESRNENTGEIRMSSVVGSMEMKEPDNIAKAIMWNYRKYMDNVIKNQNILYLPKKRFGTKCSECWDSVRMQVTKSRCLSCYGTRYSGGYGSPVRIGYVNQGYNMSTQEFFDMFDVNDASFSPMQIWIVNDVIAMPGDLIVRGDNTRFEVQRVTPSSKNGYVLRQILDIVRLPETSVLYEIPVERGVK
jgi:hypothetical protein